MPGFVGNHIVFKSDKTSTPSTTLACKLITSFGDNPKRDPPLPDINGNIFLFDNITGKLQATLEANYITGLRTAAASIVATEQLFFSRVVDKSNLVLGIIGTGTQVLNQNLKHFYNLILRFTQFQGEFHAIGFLNTQKFAKIKLWNRTRSRSERLMAKLSDLVPSTLNAEVVISIHGSVEECCKDCDVIVTATSTSTPLIFRSFLKPDVHINGEIWS